MSRAAFYTDEDVRTDRLRSKIAQHRRIVLQVVAREKDGSTNDDRYRWLADRALKLWAEIEELKK